MARAIDAEEYMGLLKEQYLHHEALGNNQIAKAWQGAMQLLYDMPTLTQPNEWVSRVRELDELYTKLQIVTGFTAEQLLEMFAAGYTLEKADHSKDFVEMANLAEAVPQTEPLTIEQLREMGGQPVYMPDTNCWALVTQNAFCPILTFPDGEKCSVYDWYEQVGPVYRRPPEAKDNNVPTNEPLTIEELREREDPVWCVCKTVEGFEGFWCLCNHGYILTPARQIFDVKEIPHWGFYRRPPKGEA